MDAKWWHVGRRRCLGSTLAWICLLTGCAGRTASPDLPPPGVPVSGAIHDKNYGSFHAANVQLLEQCTQRLGCDVALFNLGFLYAYPDSPYYHPPQALTYLGRLVQQYPQSPWAFQGQVWIALLNGQRPYPPQEVLEAGDYARFRANNTRFLAQCAGRMGCDVALFNLGFVYAYPQSPYYEPRKALHYFGQLLEQYPQTFWGMQAQGWHALLQENLAAEKAKRRAQATVRAKETLRRTQEITARVKDTPARPKPIPVVAPARAQESVPRSPEPSQQARETTIRAQEETIRTQEATIKTLQERLARSRDIDVEMDEKERALSR